MDVLTKYKSAILEFDTTQSIIGSYAGLKTSRVSRGLTEEIPFDAAEAKAISETIDAMRELQHSIHPQGVPVNWSLIGRVKPLLDSFRKQLQDKSDPMLPRYCVVKVGLNFFYRITAGEVMTRPDQLSCAAFEDPSLADEVVRELFKIGRRADVVVVPLMRRRSETVSTLSQVGFVPSEAHDVA